MIFYVRMYNVIHSNILRIYNVIHSNPPPKKQKKEFSTLIWKRRQAFNFIEIRNVFDTAALLEVRFLSGINILFPQSVNIIVSLSKQLSVLHAITWISLCVPGVIFVLYICCNQCSVRKRRELLPLHTTCWWLRHLES